MLKLLLSLGMLLVTAAAVHAQTPPTDGQIFTRGDAQLWYKVAGKADPHRAPLLYLHGGPGYNSYSFEKTAGIPLQRDIQLIYFDQRGSGRSSRPASGNYSMAALLGDIEALRQHLHLSRLCLMGQSFGGTIALEYAARHPDHVEKLILVDGAADIPDAFRHWQTEIANRYPEAWRNALAGPAVQAFQKAEIQADSCLLAKARFALAMDALKSQDRQAFADWQQFHDQRFKLEQKALDNESGLGNTGELSNAYVAPGRDYLCYAFRAYIRLTIPTLVINGTYDGVIDIDQMRSLATHLPHAIFDEFTNSAHFPYAEEPAKFQHDVVAFLTAR